MVRPPALMVQGTGSDVGKSLIVTGLCRAFTRRGLAVRPFKPQNMSNNAAVTADGGEIGRAQALQARACRTPPSVDMNPVLLKPQSEIGSQVVVRGTVRRNVGARDYHALKPDLLPEILSSFEALSAEADLMLVEGAGSPAEVNLRAGDVANMGFAEAADVPVVLVADVSRGGALASVVGTWTLLSPEERTRVVGYVINRFRGDPTLFDGAVEVIGAHTGLDCLGIVPEFPDARRLPAEDAMALEAPALSGRNCAIRVAVPRLSRIANFDDFDPLRAEDDIALEFVPPGTPLPGGADIIILPGSKATLADLAYLRSQGWDIDIMAAQRRGVRVLGLCAGYQMLGRRVADPQGLEGAPGAADGIGLLDVETILEPRKMLSQVRGAAMTNGQAVHGYEMHMGRTSGPDCERPVLDLGDRCDGARSADGRVAGCYLHGLFASDDFRHAFLRDMHPARANGLSYEASVERALDGLADHLEAHLDLDRIRASAR